MFIICALQTHYFFFFFYLFTFFSNTKFPLDSKWALKWQLHRVETVLNAQTASAKQELKSLVSGNQFHIQTASVTTARHFLLTNDKWHHCCCCENSVLRDQWGAAPLLLWYCRNMNFNKTCRTDPWRIHLQKVKLAHANTQQIDWKSVAAVHVYGSLYVSFYTRGVGCAC